MRIIVLSVLMLGLVSVCWQCARQDGESTARKKDTGEKAIERVSPGAGKSAPLPASPASGSETNTVCARVFDKPVYAAEVEQLLREMSLRYGNLQEEQFSKFKEQFFPRALNQVIELKLLEHEIDEQGIPVPADSVAQQVKRIKKQYRDPAGFQQMLKKAHITEKEMTHKIAQGLRIRALYEAKTQGITEVSEEFFNKNKKQFAEPEQVRARHILVTVDPGDSGDTKEIKRNKIKKIYERLKKGEDFETLAREYSDCPSSSKGGDLGFFSRGQMVPPFEQAAFRLQPGQISDIVETRFGYHIIKTVDRKQGAAKSFEQVKKEQGNRLLDMEKSAQFQEWLDEQKKKHVSVIKM